MLTCFWIKNQILFFKQLWPKNRKTMKTLLLAQTDRFKFKLGKKVMYSTTQRLSWQSLASRKTRLETWFSILENFRIESRVEFRKSRVGSFDFRVKRNNEFAGWMSFREVNWIREVLSCDVEGVTSRLSSCCVTKKPKNAFNLSLLCVTSWNIPCHNTVIHKTTDLRN